MIGKMLVFMRAKRDYNQHQMADRLMIPNNTLSQYENEKRTVSYDTVDLVATECDFEIFFRDKRTNQFYRVEDIISDREKVKN